MVENCRKFNGSFHWEKYWQYHDHWLGYCTNELVQINPQEKYFEFGIKMWIHI